MFTPKCKVEKIRKGSLDLFLSPSPFSENSNYGRESLLAWALSVVENKKFVDITLQCFAFYLIICKQPKNSSYLLIWLLLSHT